MFCRNRISNTEDVNVFKLSTVVEVVEGVDQVQVDQYL